MYLSEVLENSLDLMHTNISLPPKRCSHNQGCQARGYIGGSRALVEFTKPFACLYANQWESHACSVMPRNWCQLFWEKAAQAGKLLAAKCETEPVEWLVSPLFRGAVPSQSGGLLCRQELWLL